MSVPKGVGGDVSVPESVGGDASVLEGIGVDASVSESVRGIVTAVAIGAKSSGGGNKDGGGTCAHMIRVDTSVRG